MCRPFIRAFTLIPALALVAYQAECQITNVWTNTVDGNWTSALNWSNGAPVSSASTALQFGGTNATGYVASNDFIGGLTLNRIIFSATSAATRVLAGNIILFTNNGTNLPQVLQQGTGAFIISNQVNLGADTTFGGAGSGQVTVAGRMSGTGSLIKTGSYRLVLSGSNSYSGLTLISNGSVNLQANFALGTGGATAIVSSGAALELQNNVTIDGVTAVLSGSGVANAGALRNISGNNSFGGAIILSNASRINSDSGLLTLDDAVFGITGSNTALTVGGVGVTLINANIATGTGTLVKDGTGTLILAGSNSYSGLTTISNGALQVVAGSALGDSAAGTVVSATGALEFSNNVTIASEAVTIGSAGFGSGGALRNRGGTNVYAGALTITNNSRINSDLGLLVVSNAGPVNLGTFVLSVGGLGDTALLSPLAGTTGRLIKDGTGVLYLGGSNSYAGVTTVSNGALVFSSPFAVPGGLDALGGTAGITVSGGVIGLQGVDLQRGLGSASNQIQFTTNGGFAGFEANRFVNLGGNLTPSTVTWGSGGFIPNGAAFIMGHSRATHAIEFRNPIDLAGALRTVQADNGAPVADGVLAGALIGTGGLIKTGVGAISLTASNSYASNTVINTGALILSNDFALPGGIGALGGTSRLILNGGVIGLGVGDFNRSTGSNINQVQFTTNGGFAAYGANRAVNLGGNATPDTVIWGSNSFVPTGAALVLGSPDATHTIDFRNPILLSNVSRTIRADDGAPAVDGVISGVLSGTGGGITKTGLGTLTLTATNTYTGATTLGGGDLLINSDRALGAVPGAVSNAHIVLNGGRLLFGSSFLLSTNRGIQSTGLGGALGVVSGVRFTNSSVISGTAPVTKSGPGTLVLGVANTFSGGLVIAEGVLETSADNRLGTAGGTVTISTDGVLRNTASFSSSRPFTMGQGGGRIEVPAGLSLNLTGTKNFANGLSKDGPGTLVVSGTASAVAGDVTVNAGLLQMELATGIGANNTNTSVRLNGGRLLYNNSNSATASALTYELAGGTFQSTRSNQFNDPGGTLLMSGSVVAVAGTTSRVDLIDGYFTNLGNSLRITNRLTGSGTIVFAAGQGPANVSLENRNNTFAGNVIVGSNITLTASQSNASPLGAAANIVLQDGAALAMRYGGSNANTGNLFYYTNNLWILGGGSLDVRRPLNFNVGSANTNAFAELVVSNGTFQTTGDGNYQIKVFSNTTLYGAVRLAVSNNANLSLDGAIQEGTPGTSLRKTLGGTLFLTNFVERNYSGGTIVEGGTLQTVVGPGGAVPMVVTNPLGTGDVSLYGGSLNLRGDTNVILGPGSGYNFHVYSNATLSVDRFTAAGGSGRIFSANNLFIHTNALLTVNNGNGYVMRFTAPAVVETNFALAVGGVLSLDSGVVETNGSGFSFNKLGAGTLFLTNFSPNTWQGTTFVSQGTLRVHINSNNAASALGATSNIVLQGGTLDVRAFDSTIFGPGADGYNLQVRSNAAITVASITGSPTDRQIRIGNLTIANGAELLNNSANNYALRVGGTTTLDGFSAFNTVGARGTNLGSVEILGPIVDGVTNGVLVKRGNQVLSYGSSLNPTFSGGTVISAGQVAWQVPNLAPGAYQFGTGPISVDGGSLIGFAFRGVSNGNYTIQNDFIINSTISSNSIFGYGGGLLDFARLGGNSPTVTASGKVDLRGVLYLSASTAAAGSAIPGTFTGPVVLSGGDRTIQVLSSGNTGVTSNRFIIQGNISSEGGPATLTLVANNGSGIELAGTNSGLASLVIKPAYQGAVGRVRLASSNALPSGPVVVESGAFLGIGFNPGIFGTNLASLSSEFALSPGSIIGFETISNRYLLDLGPSGLNQDVRVGVTSGFAITNILPVTPFGNSYRLGGGGGTLVLAGTNQLTGTASLQAFPEPYLLNATPVVGGALQLLNSNSFTGGAVVNPGGTLQVGSSNALGSGRVDVYGTLQYLNLAGVATGMTGVGGQTNRNNVVLHPGSVLILDRRVASTSSNQFGDAETLNLNGAQLRHQGFSGSILTSEFITNLNFTGSARISVESQNAANTNLLVVSNLNRVAGGTLELNPGNGSATSMGILNRMVVGTFGAGINFSNDMISPFIVHGPARSFVTYNPVYGFSNAPFSANSLNAALPTDIIQVATNIFLGTGTTVHALRVGNNVTISNSLVTITNISGGVIYNQTAANDATIQPRLDFNGAEAVFYVPAQTLNISGAITNAAAVTKFGGGTLALAFDQPSHVGGWNINQGTVSVGNGSVTGSALGATVAGNVIALNGSAALTLNNSANNLTYSSGPVVVRDYNNAITAGFGGNSDRIQNFAPLGLSFEAPGTSPLGSLLRMAVTQSRTVLNVVGPVTLNSDVAINLQNSTFVTGGSNRVVFANQLFATNKTLTKFGNGVLALAGNNSSTFAGNIDVNGGVLAVSQNGALGGPGSVANFKANTVLELTAGLVDFNPNAAVNQQPGSAERWMSPLNRFADLAATTESFVLPTNVHLQLSTSLTNLANKTIRLNGGTIESFYFTDDGRSAPIVIGSGVTLELGRDSKIGQSGVDVGRSGVVLTNYAPVIEVGGSRSLTKVGPDTVVMATAANNYTGGTIVNQGTLRLGVDDALPIAGALAVDASGTLDFNGFNQTVTGFRGAGTLTNGGIPIALTIYETGSNVFSGRMVGAFDVDKYELGSLTLSGLSTAVGSRRIIDGTIYVDGNSTGTASPLGAPANRVTLVGISSDAQFLTKGAYNVPNVVATFSSVFAGARIVGGSTPDVSTFSGGVELQSDIQLTAAAGGRVDFTGGIIQSGGTFGVNKIGDGTVSLSGSNTYGGTTVVSAGKLLVNNTSGSGTGTGTVEVNSGSILGGNGRIGGSANINDGALLAPGNSAGTLSIDGSLNFAATAGVRFEIGGLIAGSDYDSVNVGGTASLNGLLSINLTNSYWPSTNSVFTLLTASGLGGTRFANATNNARITTTDSFGSFRINYTATNVTASGFQYFDNTGDGIFDAWAMKHFGVLNLVAGTGPTDRFGDFDGDGVNNYQEFIAGTIPTNAASRFETTTAAISGTASFAVEWRTADETTFRTPVYRIQYSSDLVNWTTVTNPSPITTPQAGIARWVDNGFQTGGTAPLNLSTPRYYRVRVE